MEKAFLIFSTIFNIQSTLIISNSKELSEILRDIRTSTYQICRIEENIVRSTTFNKYICNWTLEVRDMLKILWKRGEIAPLFQNIFYLLLDFRGTRYSLRDEWLFEISEFEIMRVNCIFNFRSKTTYSFVKCGSSNYFFFNSANLIHCTSRYGV